MPKFIKMDTLIMTCLFCVNYISINFLKVAKDFLGGPGV